MKAFSSLLTICFFLYAFTAVAKEPPYLQVNVDGFNVRSEPNFLSNRKDLIAFTTTKGQSFKVESIEQIPQGQVVKINKEGSHYYILVPSHRVGTDFRFCANSNCAAETIRDGLKTIQQIAKPQNPGCDTDELKSNPKPADRSASVSNNYPQITKPKGYESYNEAKKLCQKLSDAAKARGSKNLYIAFEGLSCINEAGVSNTNKYYSGLINGNTKIRAPRGTGKWPRGSFLLHGQIIPSIQRLKSQMDFLVVPWDSISPMKKDTVTEVCSDIWLNDDPSRKLVVLGHSVGGHSAGILAERLSQSRKNTKNIYIATVDPVMHWLWPHIPKMSGTMRDRGMVWRNYYQDGPGINAKSVKIEGADNIYLPQYGHLSITTSPIITDFISNEINQ